VAALLLGVVLLAACGTSGRTQADQDTDGRFVAGSIRAALDDGAQFKLDQQLLLMGGSVPSGQAIQVHATVDAGQLRRDAARFTYRAQQASGTQVFDMVVADQRLFAKPHSRSTWNATPVGATTTLYPALRLELIRETVLLASRVGAATTTHIDAGFVRKFTVTPAGDQLEQLESIPVSGTTEDQFLKTAAAEVDVFLVFPGDRLARVEVHLVGTDPQSGENQRIDSAIDLRSASVGTISAPGQATPVTPDQILA
jgi:hypothetical protein